jgi:hypothetical protein
MATIAERRGAVLVVTLGHGAHPFDAVARTGRHLFQGAPLCEESEHLPVTARNRLLGRAIASLQIVNRKMRLNRKSFGHAPIIHKDLVSHKVLTTEPIKAARRRIS